MDKIPFTVSTNQAMEIFQLHSRESLKKLLDRHHVQPLARGRGGLRIYRGADIERILKPVDKREPDFHDFLYGEN